MLEGGDSIAYPSHLPHFWEALDAGAEAISGRRRRMNA